MGEQSSKKPKTKQKSKNLQWEGEHGKQLRKWCQITQDLMEDLLLSEM